MNKLAVSLFSAVLLGSICLAQTSADRQSSGSASQATSVSADKSGAQAGSSTSAAASQVANVSNKNASASAANQLHAGSTVQAELTKPVDVRKNKVGDDVVAKTSHDVKSEGKVVLPKGSRIVGKITQAQARAKGQEQSQLSIAFDHAILKDGTQMPVAFTIQALSSSQAATSAAMAGDSMAMGGGGSAMAAGSDPSRGGLLGGVASTSGSVVTTAGSAAGATLNTANAGADLGAGLTANSQGVVGLPGLQLSSAVSSSTNVGSTISSNSTNVHLDSGTRMVLRVNGQ
ncbi:MAG TPA: hypothetical protein VIW67_06195 [Terriglobales bacterium]|jgi:hypothetical protein